MDRGIACVIASLLGGCGFTLSPAAGDDVPIVDAPLPDAGECLGASQTCADPSTLRTCGVSGPAVDSTCSWGCKAGSPDHCGEIVPAGGALIAADLDPAGLVDVSVGPANINVDTGMISGAITGTFTYALVGNVAVFRAKSIRFNGAVTVRGSHPVAFAANGEIVVAALLDARGSCVLSAAGPGGGLGGPFTMDGGGPGAGHLGPLGNGGGAGGGGYGAAGGRGGNGDGIGGLGGVAYGDPAIPLLIGGSGGGGGGGGGGNEFVGVGGGGGGAIQLASNTAIRIEPGGVINAGGCGGKGSNSAANDGSGGGGSGGTILLEAPVAEVLGVLAVNGGGGGGCKDVNGAQGPSGRIAASGGVATVNGGPGGFATALGGTTGATDTAVGGGGGGGVGRIRVNTRSGEVIVPGATMSPGFDDNPTTATRAPANVQ